MKNIVLVLGKEENTSFNRFTFPILQRPVAKYPLLAALYASKVDHVFLSSDSLGLIKVGEDLKDVTVLKRDNPETSLIGEIKQALKQILNNLGTEPFITTILLANSPCVTSEMIDNSILFLEKNPEYDSSVTAMKRTEFNPASVFVFDDNNNFKQFEEYKSFCKDAYFLDKRLISLKTKVISDAPDNTNYFETIMGRKIHPMIQNDGIWDIDYIWQVPIVERWLKQNGFTEVDIPYKKKETFKIDLLDKKKDISVPQKDLKKILITTVPFGEFDPTPIHLIKGNGNVDYLINPLGRKLKEDELAELVHDFDVIIAGTEPITKKVMKSGKKLKLISRVGIGLDSVDLDAARELGIYVSYTPEAPSPAVAELTIAQMLNLLRKIPLIDRKIRSGIWQRYTGDRIMKSTIGIIGTGRIGSRVLRHLQGFNPHRLLVNDLSPNHDLYNLHHAELVDKKTIFEESDIISIHVPLTPLTRNMLTINEFNL